jgi:tripeptidyl-peptidase-1
VTNFEPLERAAKTPASCNTLAPNSSITPTCLQVRVVFVVMSDGADAVQNIYGIASTPAKAESNSLLVTAYQRQYAERADLSAFLARERPDVNPNTTFTFVSLDNGTDPQSAGSAG